jgi:uncharacterized protein (UPF0218 family)
MRRNIKPIPLQQTKIIHVKNPPGTITREACNSHSRSIKNNSQVKIIVDGEEDLLTLSLFLCT